MKNLRQLLRRTKKQRQQVGSKKRRLNTEALEQRQLLAGDLLASNVLHNGWNRFDVNDDFKITTQDANWVMTALLHSNSSFAESEGETRDVQGMPDVNNDLKVSALDALQVMNAVARGEAQNELVELQLRARDLDDNQIFPDGNGIINLEKDQKFFLEVSYNDLRGFGGDIGAFQLFTDLEVSTGSVLQPVLNETQQLVFDETIRIPFVQLAGPLSQGDTVTVTGELILDPQVGPEDVSRTFEFIRTAQPSPGNIGIPLQNGSGQSFTLEQVAADLANQVNANFTSGTVSVVDARANGDAVFFAGDKFVGSSFNSAGITSAQSGSFTFTLEGSGTYVSDIADFVDSPSGEITNALTSFGYTASEFAITTLEFGNRDLGFQIKYTDPAFGNVDLPDLSVADNLNIPVIVDFNEFAPFNPDGSVNSNAVKFNLNTNSRTFPNNASFYGSLNRGGFDADTGFSSVGGVGGVPTGGQGIPELARLFDPTYNDLIEPFDAFSLLVFFDEAATGFTVGVNPGEDIEATLLYGRNEPVPQDLILVDEDATLTFNVTDGPNTPPVNSGPVIATFGETAGVQNVNLLANTTDAQNDPITVGNFAIRSGNGGGVSRSGNSNLSVDTSFYSFLAPGELEVIIYDYTVTDGINNPVAQSATITINGEDVNVPPTVSGPITQTFVETAADAAVDLLQNASDGNGIETLSVSGVTLRSGNDVGISIDAADNQLLVMPSAYIDLLSQGQTASIIYDYSVTDGVNDPVQTSATVLIRGRDAGVNEPPVVSGPVTRVFSEDDASITIDLLASSSDPDDDPLSTLNLNLVSGDARGVTANGSFSFNPGAYNDLAVNDTEVIIYNYQVTDSINTPVDTGLTITVNGANDAPEVSAAVSASFNVTSPSGSVDLLANASDVDGDTLNAASVTNTSGSDRGITVNGNSLSVDPSQYSDLAPNTSEVVVFSYNVIDGNGGSVAQTATVTITSGDNADPVLSVSPIVVAFDETDASDTVDLLLGATDPDGDTLNVSGVSLRTGNDVGITINGNSANVNPSAYSFLDGNDSELVVFDYSVTDGKGGNVAQSLRVRINGVNGDPVVTDSIRRTFSEDDPDTSFSLLAFASDPDGDALSVTNQQVTSGDGSGVMVNGNRLDVFPNAYNDLELGETEVIVVSYDVIDGNGGSVAQTATVTIIGANDGPIPTSTLSGWLFVDENGPGGRDGAKGEDESGLAGVRVHLRSAAGDNSTGVEINRTVITDINGKYTAASVQAGTYTIEYELPDNVVFSGSKIAPLVVDPIGNGTTTPPPISFPALGLGGSLGNLDILASTILAADPDMSNMSNDGLQGGSVALDENGDQLLFVAKEGFDGIRHAELTLNQARDAALLTIVDANDNVKTAQLKDNQFVVSRDGASVQFFGGLEDFDFVDDLAQLVAGDFPNRGNLIDDVINGSN